MADFRKQALLGATKKPQRSSQPAQPRIPQYDGSADEPAETGSGSQQVEESAGSGQGSPVHLARSRDGRPGSGIAISPTQGQTVVPAASSPSHILAAGALPLSTTARIGSSFAGNARFGIYPFPPAPSAPDTTPQTPHLGPADTDSVVSIYSPRVLASRRGLNPSAPPFEFGAEAMLRRGQDVQPEARNPMEPPPEHDIGAPPATVEQATRRRRAAMRHLAMAYRYLSAGDLDGVANRYDNMFEQDFGEEYTDERLRAIMVEPDDPPPEQGDDEGSGED